MNEFILAFKNFKNFSGRSRRKDFWLFTLLHTIALYGFLLLVGTSYLPLVVSENIFRIYFLGSLLPSIALTVRRLHDIDKSGWWILISPIPFGNLILVIFAIQEGDAKDNTFGPNPKAVASDLTMG